VRKLITLFLKPWVIALLLAAIVVAFLPEFFNKYKMEIVDQGKVGSLKNMKIYCKDLDHDGFSEKILSYEYKGKHSLQAITHDGGIIDQWNTGSLIAGKADRLVCGDYDKDGFDEVYTFYEKNDTVYLYCFEPLDKISPIYFTKKRICVLTHQYAEPEYYIQGIRFKDINGDGKSDLFFIINSGQSKFPRNLYVYDLSNDSIIVSKTYGSTLQHGVNISDIDDDGKKEISGGLIAAGQVSDTLGYDFSDYSAWLMVFDHKLDMLFEPIEFPGFRSNLDVIPVSINGDKLFGGYYNHTGALDNYPKLFLVNKEGDIVKEHVFQKSTKIYRWLDVKKKDNEIFFNIIDESGNISIFNPELKLIDKINLNYSINRDYNKVDLDLDGEDEFIFVSKNDEILITRNDFSDIVSLSLDFPPDFSISLITNATDSPYLFINNGKQYINLQYTKNPMAAFQYLIYLGIFLSFWLFIVVIQKLQLIQVQKKERIRNQIVKLQLKSIHNQMDPHFTFNVFNTMAYNIQEESPKSYAAFMEFSNLIRKTLLSSDSITRSIEDEISQLKSYLELEKLRFGDKVFYSIDVEEEVDQQMHIPKMIIQIYVENAIKHGIRNKAAGGTVSIYIKKKDNVLSLEIIDDGIGREKANELPTKGTGFGLKIMEDYFGLLNEYNVSKIKYKIIDVFDENNKVSGTEVRILIPLNFNYNLRMHVK